MRGINCTKDEEIVLVGMRSPLEQQVLWVKVLAGSDKKEIYVAVNAEEAKIKTGKLRTYCEAVQIVNEEDGVDFLTPFILRLSEAESKSYWEALSKDVSPTDEVDLLQETLCEVLGMQSPCKSHVNKDIINVYAMRLTNSSKKPESEHNISSIVPVGSIRLSKSVQREFKKLKPPSLMSFESLLKSEIKKIEFKMESYGEERELLETYLKLMKKIPAERLFTNPEAVALRSKRPELSKKPDNSILQTLRKSRMETFRAELALYGWTFEYENVLYVEGDSAHLDYETRTILLNVDNTKLAERLCQDIIEQVTQSDAQNRKQGIHGLTKIVYTVSPNVTSISHLTTLDSVRLYWEAKSRKNS
jgi:hypothetical protein